MARLMVAPLAALAAVGVHFAINVPPDSSKPSARDQGVAKPGGKGKKPAKKPAKKKKGFEPRPPGEVDATWARYENVDFDAEPVKSAWARPHQTLVNQAVTAARKTAFQGAPEEPKVTVGDVSCRTIRCRFVLRGPFAHEVDLLSNTLAQLELGDATIWRHFSSVKVGPTKPDQPKTDSYLQVTVAFVADSMDGAEFEAPTERDAKAPAAPKPGGSNDVPDGTPDDDDDDDEQNGNEQADPSADPSEG